MMMEGVSGASPSADVQHLANDTVAGRQPSATVSVFEFRATHPGCFLANLMQAALPMGSPMILVPLVRATVSAVWR